MLPEGRFKARAIEGGLGESSEGNPQVGVRFTILDEEFHGEEITWFGSFSRNKGQGTKTPFERTIESLRACGWKGDDLSNLEGIDANEVSLVVEHDNYNGKILAKVKWVNRAGGLALKAPMSADKAKAFAAKMRGEVIAASRAVAAAQGAPPASSAGRPPATRPQSHPNAPGAEADAPPPYGAEDDIPF